MLKTHLNALKMLKKFHYLDHSIGPVIILSSVINGLAPFIPIMFSKWLLASILNQNYKEAVIYAVIMAISFGLTSILGKFMTKVMRDKTASYSHKIVDLIHQKPLEVDYESMEDGEVINGFNNAIQALRYKGDYASLLGLYARLLQNIISLSVAFGLTLELCLSFARHQSKVLTTLTHPAIISLLLLVCIVLSMQLISKVMKWTQKKVLKDFKDKIKYETKFSNVIRMFRDDEMMKTIQAYNANELIDQMVIENSETIRKYYKSQGTYYYIEVGTKAFNSGFITLVSYMIVILKILSGAIGLDGFVKYSQAVMKMNSALTDINTVNYEIIDVARYLTELNSFLELENAFETGTIPVEKRSDHEYNLRFEDVWFKYPGSDEYVIKGVTCDINTNLKSALVGPNGAGKSTFIKLLCRLYEPTKGKITLNGVDIKKYDYEAYQSLFSVVFQDFGLFSFSIGENIGSSVEYNKTVVTDAIKKVGLDSYLNRLDETLEDFQEAFRNVDSSLEKYSGGEQQKIAIARALYKDGSYVILDEPTAALDPISEYEIYQNFDDLVGDKTCLYISHRMSSCRFCEDIIVLDQGKVVERGNHKQLIDEEGLYANMWQAQAKYYQVS